MQESPPVRKNARGPYRSGEETRQRLIDGALELFGMRGYDATSTREIAASAGVALPAITYYFAGKGGLHRACAEHVVARYRRRMASVLEKIRGVMPDTPDQARAALRRIVALLAAMLLRRDGENDAWMMFMLREMNSSGEAHDLLYRHLWAPGLTLVAELIAVSRGHAVADEDDRLEALLLLSSLSALTSARQVALEFGSWRTVDEGLVTRVSDRLGLWIERL